MIAALHLIEPSAGGQSSVCGLRFVSDVRAGSRNKMGILIPDTPGTRLYASASSRKAFSISSKSSEYSAVSFASPSVGRRNFIRMSL